MTSFEQLLDVQEHDTAVEQVRHRVSHLPERTELTTVEQDLASVAARREAVEGQRAELARTQKRLEDELAAVETKVGEVDRRLYSGTVTAPRELEALQDELTSLKRRTSVLEDHELEVMVEAEPVDAELTALDQQRAGLEARAAELRESVTAAEQEAEAELTKLAAERDAAAAGLPADLLSHYEELRRSLRTPAAARLVGTSCSGCHLTLSATEIDRIRKLGPDALVHCEECGCILVRAE